MFTKNSSFSVLYTSDIQKTHDFYKVIGAEIAQLEEDKVVIKLGDFDIHFVLDSTEPFDEYQYVTKNENRGMGILFYVEVSNIEETYEMLRSIEGALKSEIKDNHWEGREFLFQDPNGYKIICYQMN